MLFNISRRIWGWHSNSKGPDELLNRVVIARDVKRQPGRDVRRLRKGINLRWWDVTDVTAEYTNVVAPCMTARRGGWDTGVGCTSPDACRCDNVTEPLVFGHMIIKGVLDICAANPL